MNIIYIEGRTVLCHLWVVQEWALILQRHFMQGFRLRVVVVHTEICTCLIRCTFHVTKKHRPLFLSYPVKQCWEWWSVSLVFFRYITDVLQRSLTILILHGLWPCLFAHNLAPRVIHILIIGLRRPSMHSKLRVVAFTYTIPVRTWLVIFE